MPVDAAAAALQIRFARPTDRIDELRRFYCEGLGLEPVGEFDDHDGYSGFFVGLPGTELHLEFTTRADGSPGQAPSSDNLIVFYVGSVEARDGVVAQLAGIGAHEVEPENPYWHTVAAMTFEDPDGWRVVLVPSAGI
jgi:catechol 2,3-dioxygenase-like lactoylglutathione lyase family enzyme